MAKHEALTGVALHIPGYVQNSDPGAVGAGMLWVDDTVPTAPIFKIRNSADTGWTTPVAGATALTGLSDVTIASVADGQVLTWVAASSKWENVTPSGGGGGTAGFPWAAPASPNANDEEFTASLSAWTVQQDIGGSNAKTVNTGSNSLLDLHIVTASSDELRLAKAISGTWTGDVSAWAYLGIGSYANFATAEFGFLESGLNTGFLATINNDGSINGRHYTSWSANTKTNDITASGVFDVSKKFSPGYHVVLQRVSGTWSIWMSLDAKQWVRIGTTTTAITITGAAIRLAGFGATAPYHMACDFLRFNALFL